MVDNKQNQGATATLEQRAESRIKAGHTALLIAPDALPMEAWVLDVSSGGMRLRVPEAVAAGTAVRVEGPELMLFGSIAHCELHRGAYEVGIKLSQPLTMLGELRRLYAALLTESGPA
jgi:hypothetical protein